MFDDLVNSALYEYHYDKLYFLFFGYFLFLYFIVGSAFLGVCKLLSKYHLVNKIIDRKTTSDQTKREVFHSMKSIVIFGFSGLPIIFLIRAEWIQLLPDSFINIVAGLLILTIWNEIHFFLVHRAMHKFNFLKKMHAIHHQSTIPTVYSVYSFHWFEALLLSTVPLTIAPIIPFSPIALFLYPLCSILLNFSGHCNYRFGNGKGAKWKLFGSLHSEHHSTGRKNYGFGSHLLDHWFGSNNSKKTNPKQQQ